MSFLVPAAAEHDDIWTMAAGQLQWRRARRAFYAAAAAICSVTWGAGHIASAATSVATAAHASAFIVGLAGTFAAPAAIAVALLVVSGLYIRRIAQTKKLSYADLWDDPRVSRAQRCLSASFQNGSFLGPHMGND